MTTGAGLMQSRVVWRAFALHESFSSLLGRLRGPNREEKDFSGPHAPKAPLLRLCISPDYRGKKVVSIDQTWYAVWDDS